MNVFRRLKKLYGPLKIKADYFMQTVLNRKSYLALGFLAIYGSVVYVTATEHEK